MEILGCVYKPNLLRLLWNEDNNTGVELFNYLEYKTCSKLYPEDGTKKKMGEN